MSANDLGLGISLFFERRPTRAEFRAIIGLSEMAKYRHKGSVEHGYRASVSTPPTAEDRESLTYFFAFPTLSSPDDFPSPSPRSALQPTLPRLPPISSSSHYSLSSHLLTRSSHSLTSAFSTSNFSFLTSLPPFYPCPSFTHFTGFPLLHLGSWRSQWLFSNACTRLPRGASSKVVKGEAQVWEAGVDAEECTRRATRVKKNQNDRPSPTGRNLNGRDHWYRCLPQVADTNWVPLMIVDTVASLSAGQSTCVDTQRIDICLSDRQKGHLRSPGRHEK